MFPLFALIATKYPSKLPKNNTLPRIARPLLTRPQHKGRSAGTFLLYVQTTRPDFASSATTLAGGVVKKTRPSATSGVASILDSVASNCRIHLIRSWATFAGVISLAVV